MPEAATLSPADSGRRRSFHRNAVCSWTHRKARSNQTPQICLTQLHGCNHPKSYRLCNSYCPKPPSCILSTVSSLPPAEEIRLHGREWKAHGSALCALVRFEREHPPTTFCG